MSQGLSYESFGGVISVSVEVLYDWEKMHDEFLQAKKRGVTKSLLRHERMLNSAALNKKMNPTPIIFAMKCRFRGMGWNPVEQRQGDEEIDLEFE